MQKVGSKRAEGLSAGLDEVGMGCWAGPICVATVAFPAGAEPIEGVGDSKGISFNERMRLAPVILQQATFFGVGFSHPHVVDEVGPREAWRRACLDALREAPDFACLHIDGDRCVRGYRGRQITYVKGDALVWQIGAASIVAKVIRDLDMIEMGEHYPQYRWASNMGYGTAAHQEGLAKYGPTHYHRGRYLRNLYVKLASVEGVNGRWRSWEKRWLNEDLATRVRASSTVALPT